MFGSSKCANCSIFCTASWPFGSASSVSAQPPVHPLPLLTAQVCACVVTEPGTAGRPCAVRKSLIAWIALPGSPCTTQVCGPAQLVDPGGIDEVAVLELLAVPVW